MARVVSIEIELEGTRKVINDLGGVKDAVKGTNKELENTRFGTAEYGKLQKQLGSLKSVQGQVRKEQRALAKDFELSQVPANSIRALEIRYAKLKDEIKLTDREADKAKFDNLVKQAGRLRKEIDGTEEKLGSFRGNLVKAARGFANVGDFLTGGLLLGGATAIASGIQDLTLEFFNLGVQADTLQRKNLTVLGEAFGFVSERAKQTANDLGLTENQYISQTAAIADILKPIGFLETEAAELGTQLVDLSGALSEWSGGQIQAEEAAGILSKALLGEREQLKQFGVVIKEADVSARLAEKGLKGLTGAALQQAKALATVELITEKSTDAQRAYAENSDSLIRTQARLSASYQSIRETIASSLIPVFATVLSGAEPLVKLFAQTIPSAIEFLKATFSPLTGAISNFVNAIFEGSDASSFFSKALSFVGNSIQQTIGLISGLINFIAKLIQFYRGVSQESGILGDAFRFVGSAVQGLIDLFLSFPAVLGGITNVVKNFGGILESFFAGIIINAQIAFADLRGLVDEAQKENAARLREVKAALQEQGITAAEAFTEGFNSVQNNSFQLPKPDDAEIEKAREQFDKIGQSSFKGYSDAADKAGESTDNLTKKLQGLVTGAAQGSITKLQEEVNKFKKELDEASPENIEEAAAKLIEAQEELDKAKAKVDKLLDADDPEKRKKIAEDALKAEIETIEFKRQERIKLAQEEEVIEQDLAAERKRINLETDIEILQSRIDSSTLTKSEVLKAENEIAAKRKELSQLDDETSLQKRLDQIEREKIAALKANADKAKSAEDFNKFREKVELETEKKILQARLNAAQENSLEKEQLALQLAEKELEINEDKNQKLIEQEKKNKDERQEINDQIIAGINSVIDTLSQANSQFSEQAVNEVEERYQAEQELVEERFDNEIEAARGNSQRVEQLEEQKAQALEEIEENRVAEVERIQRNAFERDKALNAIQAGINGAVAVTKALAQLGPIAGAIAAIAIGATTFAQISFINSQRFDGEEGLMVSKEMRFRPQAIKRMAEGGTIQFGDFARGRLHAQGGIKTRFHGVPVEIEDGEFVDYDEFGNIVVINRKNSKKFAPALKAVGGKSFSGKLRMLSNINSFNGNGIPLIAQNGAAIQPNITPALAASAGTVVSVTMLELSEEQIDMIASAVRTGAMEGSREGSAAYNNTANRENERQNNLNSIIG